MPTAPVWSSPPIRRTTFLVPSIHCPTCASFVEDLLYSLSPRPAAVETSIVFHSVNVACDYPLSTSTISNALGNAGYDVEAVVTDYPQGEASLVESRGSATDNFPFAWVTRLGRSRKVVDEETKKKRHVEHCQQCRKQQERATSAQTSHASAAPPKAQKADHPSDSISEASSIFKASLSISGMSCSSCVGKITAALEQKPWVRSASVALLTQSADVEFEAGNNAEEIVRVIESLGYAANLEHVDRFPSDKCVPEVGSNAGGNLWRAVYSVGGMTCSSCVGSIAKALDSFPWTTSVDVNLITNSATVVFEDKAHLGHIAEAIAAAGYDAKLNDLVDLTKNDAQDGRRTVSIHIDGMHCDQCPARAIGPLGRFNQRVTLEKPATIKDPIMIVSYTPESPEFTVRAIISAVSTADEAFIPTIYHPPTVEERARRMHIRIRQRIFYRVLLSVLVAIPSFTIGIVYMTLVPQNNPGRHYLMERLRGVTRGEWALLVLATPVYFFAADVFHRRAIKELYSLSCADFTALGAWTC